MTETMQKTKQHRGSRWVVLIIFLVLLGVWLALTPPGLLGKLDAIGYAVCHRIDGRSYHIGERQVPLCVRCTGMYLGAMLSIIFQLAQGRKGKYPPLKTILVMGLLALAFALDGVNSYLRLFPIMPGVYESQNWLRLVTGMGMGLAIGAAIVPAFHQTMWQSWEDRSGLGSWKQLALLLLLAAGLSLLVLTESIYVMVPAAIISALGVYLLLAMIYAMVWAMLSKKDNTYKHYKELWRPLLGGALIALLQIAAFDLGRYLLTGTWSGFNL